MSETYTFSTDSGELVEVDFETMMGQQNGFITLPDGTKAKRVNTPIGKPKRELPQSVPVVSDNLGFCDYQLPQFEEHLKRTGIKGVEFKRDPGFPGFIQVHADSEARKMEYARSRGLDDMNSKNGSGAALSPELLERTIELVSRG